MMQDTTASRGLEMTSQGPSSDADESHGLEDLDGGLTDVPVEGDSLASDLQADFNRQTPHASNSNCSPTLLLAAFGLLTICVVAIGFGLSSNQSQPFGLAPQGPLYHNKQEALDTFKDQLNRPDTLQRISTPDSAQAKAYQWLSNDPNITDYPQWRLEQRFALAALYYSLNGPYWPSQWQDSWLSYQEPECHWEKSVSSHTGDLPEGEAAGIEHGGYEACGQTRFDYHRIILAGIDNLQGILPDEISLLTALKEIELTRMQSKLSLDDFLPINELQKLTDLTRLDLSNVNLAGSTIPSELGRLSSLHELHLTEAQLVGTLPPQLLNQLTNVRTLSFYGNAISGSLPSEYGQASTALEVLWLYENQITGTLPTEWAALLEVDSIYLKDNALTGTLPEEWSALSDLVALRLSDNKFEGSIPDSYGENMNHLLYFGIDGNPKFSGTIPPQWCRRGNEMYFWVDCDLVTCCDAIKHTGGGQR